MGGKESKLNPTDLSDLVKNTEFTQREIKDWFKGFQQDYPNGYLTKEEFMKIYTNFYPKGNAGEFAGNVFRVFDHNKDGQIDFKEFMGGLSMSMKV